MSKVEDMYPADSQRKLANVVIMKIELWAVVPPPQPEVEGMDAITFDDVAASKCAKADLAMVRHLHQNLGLPSNGDLARSLTIA